MMTPPTILLVEDEPMIAHLYHSILGMRPYMVLTAFNKQAAIQMIIRHRPHVILLDLMIPLGPGESLISYDHPVGFDILEWVNNHPELQHTKVAILTNLESEQYKKHAEQLGVSAYIVKAEHDPHELLATVESLLETKT